MACDFGTNDRDCYLYYIVKRNGDIEILDFIEKDEGTAVNS